MLNPQLVLMLKFLELLLWRLLVVLLVLCRWLDRRLKVLADEKNLAVLVVEVLGFDLAPCQSTELFDDPANGQSCLASRHQWLNLLFGKVGLLRQLALGRSATLRVLDADDEAALIFDAEIYGNKLVLLRR